MVEQTISLDRIFQALADATRRDILARVADGPLSVSDIAQPYSITYAAVAKHLSVLEDAQLVRKETRGKERVAQVVPQNLARADAYLQQYQMLWENRLDRLEEHLSD